MHSRSYQHLYKTSHWTKARKAFLSAHPVCCFCKKTLATVVDHIQPHRGDEALFYDQTNWQPLCKPCHDSTKKQIESKGYSKAIGPDGLPLDPNHPFYG